MIAGAANLTVGVRRIRLPRTRRPMDWPMMLAVAAGRRLVIGHNTAGADQAPAVIR
jgi:hypothetical protein